MKKDRRACNLFKVGHRIGLKIICADVEENKTTMVAFHVGHAVRQTQNKITIYYDANILRTGFFQSLALIRIIPRSLLRGIKTLNKPIEEC
jgi:hypothetical protein